MKRAAAIFLSLALTVSLAACSSAPSGGEPSSVSRETSARAGNAGARQQMETEAYEETEGAAADGEDSTVGNVLIAYFSWADNAVLTDGVDAISSPSVFAPGNVQQLAGWVQEKTGGDLFSIQVTDPYPSDWDACLERANKERGDDARPELAERVENMESYDVVFLGYPNWWYGVPMALLSFLEQNDMSGKQIYLFCSHGTGGLARSVEIIEEALPGVEISDNIFDCYEEEAPDSREEIEDWLTGLGY